MNYPLIILFIACIFMIASSAIGIKLYNEYSSFLEEHKTTDKNAYDAWVKSYEGSFRYLIISLSSASAVVFGIFIYGIYLIIKTSKGTIKGTIGFIDSMANTTPNFNQQSYYPYSKKITQLFNSINIMIFLPIFWIII